MMKQVARQKIKASVRKAIRLLHTAKEGEQAWFDKFRKGDQCADRWDEEDVDVKERGLRRHERKEDTEHVPFTIYAKKIKGWLIIWEWMRP